MDRKTPETRRCFLGLALPAAQRAALAAFSNTLRRKGLKGAWVREENFHVTLRFLGDLAPDQLDTLESVLPAAFIGCGPLQLQLAGTGVFPHPGRPRVFWAGIRVLCGEIGPLFDAAETGARAIGLPPERRPPHPHVTLLRLREGASQRDTRALVEHPFDIDWDAIPVTAVALWESRLLPGGAAYEKLREFPLS